MTHKLRYYCYFCRKPGEVEYDDANPLSEAQVAFWLTHVACNPCAEYHRTTRDSIRAIHQIFEKWAAAKGGQHDGLEARSKIRNKLAAWLDRLGAAVAKFHRCQNRFDPQMVETIIDEPNRMSGVIRELTRFKA